MFNYYGGIADLVLTMRLCGRQLSHNEFSETLKITGPPSKIFHHLVNQFENANAIFRLNIFQCRASYQLRAPEYAYLPDKKANRLIKFLTEYIFYNIDKALKSKIRYLLSPISKRPFEPVYLVCAIFFVRKIMLFMLFCKECSQRLHVSIGSLMVWISRVWCDFFIFLYSI